MNSSTEKLVKEIQVGHVLLRKRDWYWLIGGFLAVIIAVLGIGWHSIQKAIDTIANDEIIRRIKKIEVEASAHLKEIKNIADSAKAIEIPRWKLVRKQNIKIALRGNAGSWVIVPFQYQNNWHLRVYHNDAMEKDGVIKDQTMTEVKTEFLIDQNDFLICSPTMNGDEIIIRGFKYFEKP